MLGLFTIMLLFAISATMFAFGIKRKARGVIRFAKTRDVKNIARGTSLSAGLDFFVPNDFPVTEIAPGEAICVPSGIKVNFDEDLVLIGFNKSGIAAKKNLIVGAQVVDADYQGEIHLDLHNVGKDTVVVSPGDKLTQFILLRTYLAKPIQVEEENLYAQESERKDGKMGSTGTR